MENNVQQNRLDWIDALRGLAILAMIFHHILYNAVNSFGYLAPWLSAFLESAAFTFVQVLFLAVFLGISGLCCHFTKHPVRRSLKVLAAAGVVSAVTAVFSPDMAVYFGVLHLLGTLMLVTFLAKRALFRLPPVKSAAFCLFLFLLTYHLPDGYLGFGALSISLPKTLYIGGMLTPLGFPHRFFASMDYLPLFPYMFLFFIGVFLGNGKIPRAKWHMPFLSFCGRHSLAVYLLHQPLILGVFYCIAFLLKG